MKFEFQTIDTPTRIVSEGTLRRQDLIPAFLEAVRDVAPDHYAGLTVAPFGPIPSYVQDEGDDSDWWDSEDAAQLLEDLQTVLEEDAPDGTFFSTQDGDGACLGFFPLGPSEDDYAVWQSGDDWCWRQPNVTHHFQVEGSESACCEAIRDHMNAEQFWPNIWWDKGERGDYSQVVIQPIGHGAQEARDFFRAMEKHFDVEDAGEAVVRALAAARHLCDRDGYAYHERDADAHNLYLSDLSDERHS